MFMICEGMYIFELFEYIFIWDKSAFPEVSHSQTNAFHQEESVPNGLNTALMCASKK